jgi:hypothetical protein
VSSPNCPSDAQDILTCRTDGAAVDGNTRPTEWIFWLLAACFAVLLVVRINSRVFFSDEISTIYVAKESLARTIHEVVRDVHPPLYFVTAHVFVHLFPAERLRILSALYAFLAFLVLRRLVPMLLPKQSTHLPYLILFASSPFIIFVGRMARYYSLALLLAVIATYCLLAYMRDARRIWCALYFLSILALIYTSYLAVVMILAHVMYILARKGTLSKSKKYPLALSLLLAGVCYLPWLVVAVRQYQAVLASGAYHFSIVHGLSRALLNCVYAFYCFALGDSIAPWNVLRASVFLLPWIIACTMGIREYKRRRDVQSCTGLFFFALPLAAALLLLLIAYQQMNLIYVPMRIAFLSPFFLLLAAEGFSPPGKKQHTVLLAALLLVNGVSLFNYYTNRETTNWAYTTPVQDILDTMNRLRTDDTLTIVDNYNFNREFEYYSPPGPVQGLKEQDLSATGLRELCDPYPRVLFLYATNDASPDAKVASMIAFLKNHYRHSRGIGFIEEDTRVRRMKELIVRREVKRFKIYLDLFERSEAASRNEQP